MANLESHVLQNPEDLDARLELLRIYLATAPIPPNDDPGRRSVRLQHILYLVEHHPEAAVSASRAAYVYRAKGPYANLSDHEAVRDQWLASIQAHPQDIVVTLHAVRFLKVEDTDDAEHVLQRAMNADPENRELAANLGFLYAEEMLASLASPAKTALEQTSNAVVLAAAGTALANLSKARSDFINGTMFDFANQLFARARMLAPDDPDIQGPMPLIKYFVAAEDNLQAASAMPASSAPSRIRVTGNVQAMNLIRKNQPQYPEEARNAGITGDVRLSAIIGRDGAIQNLQLISGHPLLVQAAIQAVETWLYKPTLLNGAPVEVVTAITVSFPPN